VIFVDKLKNNRGSTLVELIVVIALSSLVLGILISILFTMNYQYKRIQREAEIFAEVQLVRKQITLELKNCNDASMTASSNEITYDGTKKFVFDQVSKKLTKIYGTQIIGDVIFDYIDDITFIKKSTRLLEVNISYNNGNIQKIYFHVAGGM
jgi:competence protein ComGC